MRAIILPLPPTFLNIEAKLDWIMRCLFEIERASKEPDAEQKADEFTVTNLTPSRTFDADAVTTAQLADVVGTFLTDLKTRGSKRA